MTTIVTAAVIERAGTFLVTRRPAGVHLEGYWEFPGGKCEPDESLDACLRRELLAVSHDYPDRRLELHFLACSLHGEPTPLLGQQMQWVARASLRGLAFPPADDELIALLERDER